MFLQTHLRLKKKPFQMRPKSTGSCRDGQITEGNEGMEVWGKQGAE